MRGHSSALCSNNDVGHNINPIGRALKVRILKNTTQTPQMGLANPCISDN